MRLDQGVRKQLLHDSLETQLLSNKVVQSVWIRLAPAATSQQLKPKVLMVQVCPKLEELRRCGVQSLDVIV